MLIVLRACSGADLEDLGAALGPRLEGPGLAPMVVTMAEIQSAGDVFPVRFGAIRRQHELLHGSDPFDGLEIHREHLRLRVEQELRNMSLRLRRRFLASHGDALDSLRVLRGVVWPLSGSLRGLLELQSPDLAIGDGPPRVLPAAGERLGLDKDTLERLCQLWLNGTLEGETKELFRSTLELVTQAAERADALEEN